MIKSKMLHEIIFWGIWLIIPLLWEILISVASAIFVLIKKIKLHNRTISYCPMVTVLIPIYNSEETLEACLQSVYNQDYSLKNIEVILVDNGSNDRSFDIFKKYRDSHPDINIWWLNSQQGKSKALNKGIFESKGKYIINIDSDGSLDKDAIKNIVHSFENDDELSCITGVVLIDLDLVHQTKNLLLKTLRLCEFYEYIESFLIGRNFESITNSMYTIAGAFSCFKREVLAKTLMYNHDTIGEDTHMTFQIRELVGGKIILCHDAFFYVDPIESMDKLYTQRQRWQRGEIEVASLFTNLHTGHIIDFFKKFSMRILVSDHTMAFPRLMWFFAMIYLCFVNYPIKLLVIANILIYGLYVINSIINLLTAGLYLTKQTLTKEYCYRHWYMAFIMPGYRFITFGIRLAGIMNSINTKSKWRTRTLSEEMQLLDKVIVKTLKEKLWFLNIFNKFINNK